MNFSNELIFEIDENTKSCLVQLYLSGLQLSEDDPLLFIVPDFSNVNSIAFLNNGNYGLAAGQPGFLPWPGTLKLFFSTNFICLLLFVTKVAFLPLLQQD
jgi:hypothetical protein